ncbi:hypothetical protein GQ44DRAFT_689926 [Phaeosphaeriaceae sp. PMI808]|nr:hypothetical protein GQ44DRAFT_689926 [Phaeosphaeriaceae sp. PMI808]
MGDDWQDAAFSSRHIHNRVQDRRNSKSKPFDVRKTFGTYTIKCGAWQKLDDVQSEATASLETYRLTENGEGVVGVLDLPGALRAAVVMAASRASLRQIVEEMESGNEEAQEDDEDDDSNTDEHEQDRFETFEKNSFRSPKFWFRWSGEPSRSKSKAGGNGNADLETGLGYIVFCGNDCRKFKGTINCASFGWKDVAIAGNKVASRSESDVMVTWAPGVTM